jgi:glucose-1-phosphate thymidylyltransferase
MIDKGAKIRVVDVDGWYDAGKLETLLETNQDIL